MRHIRR